MAFQTSSAMVYLSKQKIIHRDLALRNILASQVGDQHIIKIGDFGLADYRRSSAVALLSELPLKWCAPEIFTTGEFSSFSDVWAFGIVLWEIFTYGKKPYPEFTAIITRAKVLEGYRMSPPENCPIIVSELMQWCWKDSPNERPLFIQIYIRLSTLWKEVKSSLTRTLYVQIPENPDIDLNIESGAYFD